MRFDEKNRSTWPPEDREVLIRGDGGFTVAALHYSPPWRSSPDVPHWWLPSEGWEPAEPGDQWVPLPGQDGSVYPVRGDSVAAWLKARRDEYSVHTLTHMTIDDLLNEWRLRADLGISLADPLAGDEG